MSYNGRDELDGRGDGENSSNEGVEVFAAAAMVGDSSAKSEVTVKQSAGEDGHTGFLEPKEQLAIQGIDGGRAGLGRTVAKADNVERNRSEQFQLWLRFDESSQVARLRDVLLDEASVLLDAVGFERHPDFQRSEAASEFDAATGEGQAAGDEAAVGIAEVVLVKREGCGVSGGVTDENAADFEGEIHPFVEIEGQRVGEFDAVNDGPELVGEAGECAEGAVDVEPEVLFTAERGEGTKRVGGANVDGAGVADNAEGEEVLAAVAIELRLESVEIDGVSGGHGNAAERRVAKSEEFGGFLAPAMGLRRCVEDEARAVVIL